MKILVANLGSTSFKYRLFDMDGQRQLARGGIERIGSPESRCTVADSGEIGGNKREMTVRAGDHVEAVHHCLAQLTDPEHGCLREESEVAAIAFKTVHGGRYSGVQRVTPEVLAAMEEMCGVAPAHNPPYIAAMRLLAEKLPQIPLVAAFETDFHATIPEHNRVYAIPYEWTESAVRPPLGIPRREPPLHRRTDGRVARPRRTCGSSPATWAAPVRSARSATGGASPPAWA